MITIFFEGPKTQKNPIHSLRMVTPSKVDEIA